MLKTQEKAVVIDTEQYTGNFVRDICTYVTGQSLGCRTDDAVLARALPFIEHLSWWNANAVCVTEDGRERGYSDIFTTPGWINLEGGHRRDDTDTYTARLAVHKKRHEHAISIFRKKLEDQEFGGPGQKSKSELEASIREREHQIASLGAERKGKVCPAYLSVALFVRELPPEPVLTELVQRAHKFAEDYKEICPQQWQRTPIKISGFRLSDPETGELSLVDAAMLQKLN